MKSAAEIAKVVSVVRATPGARRSAWGAYWELTKPEVNFLVLTATFAGFYLGTRVAQGGLDWLRLFHTLVGTGLVASGTATLNQLFEREVDARMHRTAQRPLPAGRLRPRQAAAFGAALALVGMIELATAVNLLASLLAALTLVSYLFAYTPLKTRTSLCTTVGAFPGAMPVLVGWAAAGQGLGIEAWVLYTILFFWQFPHFLAIAWLYREDYARGGVVMLPRGDMRGSAMAWQIVLTTLALFGATLAAALVGLSGRLYLAGAIVLGAALFYYVLRLAQSRSATAARTLVHATVIYLPLLYGLMILDKVPR